MRWKFIFATLSLGTILTVVLILQLTPQYSSTARLFISTPNTGQADSYSASLFATQRVTSYADLAKEPAVLQRVVDQLGLNMTRQELAGKITTTVVPNTLLLEVAAKAGSAQQAQLIAAAEADEIIKLVAELEKPKDASVPAVIVARLAGKASLDTTPVSPNVVLDLIIGIMLSLFIGVAGAVLRDLLDTTVKSRQDIETATGNAVMATLPYDPMVKKKPLSIEDGSGDLGEAFRVLRTNLQFANLDASRQMILVSSALPDEGKTLVATNLAISIAKSGRSVLLVDADMRNPGVAKLMGLENSVGVMTILLGRSTLEQATQEHVSGVSFLATGPQPPNPAEVLETQAMRDLLASVRSGYDVVIIDAPPMLPVADAAILSTAVDGTLLIARFGSTSREYLRLAVSRIETVGGRMFGTILNRTPRQAGYGYGYGYGTTRIVPNATKADTNEGILSRAGRRAKR